MKKDMETRIKRTKYHFSYTHEKKKPIIHICYYENKRKGFHIPFFNIYKKKKL